MEIQQLQSFEAEVYLLIKACCSNNEFIDRNHHEKYDGNMRVFDIWLPLGCEKLDFPSGTAIEIKYNLLFDTIDRLKVLYDKADVSNLVVITNDESKFSSNEFTSSPIRRRITIMSISDLRKKVEISLGLSTKDLLYSDGSLPFGSMVDSARKAFQSNRVTLFIGAGVSKDAQLVDWFQLQNELLNDDKNNASINLTEIQQVDRNSDIISGRYIKSVITGFDGWHSGKRFDKKIKSVLYSQSPQPSKLIDAITQMARCNNVESIITYNYDDLLESNFGSMIPNRPIYEGGRTSLIEKPVYHIHGYAPQGDNSCSRLVFCEEDYHEQYKNSFLWSNNEQLHALNRNTCLFIGLSMLDPNLRRLLDFSSNSYPNESSAPHYAFMKRETGVRMEVNYHTEKVLHNIGVNVVWYDNYSDLPGILLSIIK